MNFEEWWVWFRGFDDENGKEGARMAFEAGMQYERQETLKNAEYESERLAHLDA